MYSPALTLIVVPSAEMRMGIALSKKHGKAVVRNRIKRLIREAFNKNSHMLKKNWAVVVMPHPAEEYSFVAFEKSFLNCFKKVNGWEK